MTHVVPCSLAAQRRLDWRDKGQNQAAVLQEGGADSLDNVLAAEQLSLLSDLIICLQSHAIMSAWSAVDPRIFVFSCARALSFSPLPS